MQVLAEIVESHFATKKDLEILEYRLTIKVGTIVTIAVGVASTIVTLIVKLIN